MGNSFRPIPEHSDPAFGEMSVAAGAETNTPSITELQERELRMVIDAVPALIAYIDRNFRYRYVNRRYSEWFCRSAREIEGRTIEEAFGPAMWAMIEDKIRKALAGETVTFLLHHEYPDQARWVRATYVPDIVGTGEVRGVVILVQDVTEAQKAEEELRRSEEQYRFLANALPQMVWVANAAGETEFLNDFWYEYTGATREEGIRAWDRVVPPGDAAAVVAAWQAAAPAGKPFEIEHRVRRGADGVERWHLSRINPVLDARGEPARWIGTALDIHDRKTSELELSKARRDLSDILESITESFIALDRDWRFVYVNAQVAKRLQVSREDLIGRNIWESVEEIVKTLFYPKYRQVMEQRVPLQFEVAYPGDRWFEVHAHPTEAGMSAYIVDKTEQKRTEEALRQKAKLESLGLLAGGVAHDFNNLLVGILGAAGLAQEMVDPDRPEFELLRLIADSAQRAADLTRQMLTFAGKSSAEKHNLDLNNIIGDTVRLMRSTVPSRIQLTLDLDPALPEFMGDPGQVQQIVLNLLTNAVEAVPQPSSGSVVIHTELRKEAAPRAVGATLLYPGDYILLEVSDTGQGMSPDVVARIFDPFFTTKFAGRGLGLAAVQGIVRAHEGSIEVVSSPGHGATFRVLLRATPRVVETSEETPAIPALHSGTVLVIDDEFAVRATSERILRHYGYEVLVAGTAAGGAELFRKHRESLTAVLLDVSMPDQSGFDVLRQLAGELGDIRVILSSGHDRHDLEPDLVHFPTVRFLRKPYRGEELLKVLVQPD